MHTSTPEFLQAYRCTSCGKLLFKGVLIVSTIQVKCRKCGTLATFGRLDDITDEDQFSLLVDNTGTVVATGQYKKAFCGPQQNLVGTKLFALLLLMGHEKQYETIMNSLETPNQVEIRSLSANILNDRLTLQWRLMPCGTTTYIYLLLNKRTKEVLDKGIQESIEIIPTAIKTTDAALA